MANLIDRSALIEKLGRAGVLPEYVKFLIEQEPSIDAVPVVRCKDCKYSNAWKDAWGTKGLDCKFLPLGINPLRVDPKGFCSYGEPKEDNNG